MPSFLHDSFIHLQPCLLLYVLYKLRLTPSCRKQTASSANLTCQSRLYSTDLSCNFVTDKSQLSQTKPRDTVHHSKRVANKSGRSVW